ncbi:putative sugar nucleotidyl transferase [Blattabacterium cuenoti]|uniref:putative sugar nucleotidyl transferase n=1 Tax=Blattabacterium cuenoti TaxID=1653831 RepID=UPI00163C2BE8|nr:putative sugar nucleotidyl transferase [Blattabacterium cuenoti]
MNFVLYDGLLEWKNLFPLTLTRSISEIRLGMFTIKERWKKYLEKKIVYIVTQSFLMQNNFSDKHPLTIEDAVLINSSFIPNQELIGMITTMKKNEKICLENGDLIATRYDHFLYEKDYHNGLLKKEYWIKESYIKNIIRIKNIYDILMKNEIVLKEDFRFFSKKNKSYHLLGKNVILCKEKIFLEENIKTNNIVLNAEYGPIYIQKGVKILEGSVIRGPVSIGKNTTLSIGSKIYGNTTIGQCCKVGGEIVNSVIFSYSNKSHDGFLGNSIIGKWCNLGSGTNVSNLRNDYKNVTLWNYEKKMFIPTNIQFFGTVMGDHSKSSINTQLNTATLIGVGCSIFGYGFPPRYIPSFSLGCIQNNKKVSFKEFCETIDIVMNRRNKNLDFFEKSILKYLYQLSNI